MDTPSYLELSNIAPGKWGILQLFSSCVSKKINAVGTNLNGHLEELLITHNVSFLGEIRKISTF